MTARIYVACLASYNNGTLYGKWIDASTDVDEMAAEIADMLRGSPYPNVMRAKYENGSGDVHYSSGTNGEFPPSYESEGGETWARIGEPFRSAEEYAIHDYEGLGPNLGEYAGLEEVAKRVAIAEVAEERDIPVSVLIEAMSDAGADDAEDFVDDRYRGEYDTWKDFAREFTEEVNDISAVPEWLQGHIDWDSVARDFQCGGDLSAYRDGEYGSLYFFWNH
jgi:antirestriction protein